MTEENLQDDVQQTDGLDTTDTNSDDNVDESKKENTINDDNQDDSDNVDNNDNQKDDNDGEMYGAPEQFDFSETKLPDGMNLDQELLGEFEPIAKKLNLSNKSANELMGLAVKLSQKNLSVVQDAINQAQIAEKNSYMQLLDNDAELNAKNPAQYEPYLNVAIQGLNAVATKGFKEFISEKGLTHHPEFIKVFHNIGKLCQESKIPEGNNPIGKEEDQADILYAPRTEES